ncbi:MAG: hypothetical protein GKR87_09370 [Kiritimatiellae bacterium]|nr:hypothetical protein [Kiritimatiellia bacterium]
MLVEDVIQTSLQRLDTYKPESPEAIMQCSQRVVTFSQEMMGMIDVYLDSSVKRGFLHEPFGPKGITKKPRRTQRVCLRFFATFCLQSIRIEIPRLTDGSRVYRTFLFKNVYHHFSVDKAHQEAVHMMKRLFQHYVYDPQDMGHKAQARLKKEGRWRTACDYVSGMTDRYAIEEYQKFGLNKR